ATELKGRRGRRPRSRGTAPHCCVAANRKWRTLRRGRFLTVAALYGVRRLENLRELPRAAAKRAWTRCLSSYKILAMKNLIAVVLSGMVLPALAAFAATMNDPKDEKSVMATLQAMAQATIKKDVATLDKIYHPDLTYSHSSAMNQAKAEVLKAV